MLTKIVIDTSEKRSRIDLIKSLEGFDIEERQLQVGDYLVGEICIEFKEFSDFMGSFTKKDSKGFRQLHDMAANYEKRILVICGTLESHFAKLRRGVPKYKYMATNEWFAYRGGREAAFLGAIRSIVFNSGVSVIMIDSEAHLKKFIKICASKEESNSSSDRPVITTKNSDRKLPEESEDMLCALTGVGRVAAKKILAEYGSIANLVAQLVEMDESDKRLKTKTMKHVRSVIMTEVNNG